MFCKYKKRFVDDAYCMNCFYSSNNDPKFISINDCRNNNDIYDYTFTQLDEITKIKFSYLLDNDVIVDDVVFFKGIITNKYVAKKIVENFLFIKTQKIYHILDIEIKNFDNNLIISP